MESQHISEPHWPGTVRECPACLLEIEAEEERAYDEMEHAQIVATWANDRLNARSE